MAEPPRLNAVIRFEADGYDVNTSWLMGRQVAGHGFLRAFVGARAEGPLCAYTASQVSAQAFARMVRGFDPAAECRWIPGSKLGRIEGSGGVLYLADPSLPAFARARMRVGVASYSLCGVTHTTATSGTMQALADLLSAPVAPWDALVCTSKAVVDTVRRVQEAEADMLRWRLGDAVRIAAPQLPIIPLGVHCDDFEFPAEEREASRGQLGIGPDEIVALFVGRLTFTSKHHPFAMYRACQAAAERTGKRLVLLQCGWSPNEAIASAFTRGPETFCPDVRALVLDGRDARLKRQAWASADLFISLSDGIQETFGLTPIEAMAAGLPCIVTDWDGYRDTVRDGVDGWRIRTWAPAPGAAGEAIAREQEVGETDYDNYLWTVAAGTSVDLRQLADRVTTLVERPDLRRSMGEAGRARARDVFDWSRVIRQYHALWAELNAIRAAARDDPAERAWIERAPRAAPAWLDPFDAFGHYPSSLIGPDTMLSLTADGSPAVYAQRRAHILFGGLRLPHPVARAILARLAQGPATVTEVALAADIGAQPALYVAGVMAKMGLVQFD